MSVPPEVLAQMKNQMGGAPQPGAPLPMGAPDPGAGPAAAPMAKPQNKDGLKEAARINVHIAMNMLEQALPAFGSESKEGKAILRHLSGLAKDFGEHDAGDLVPAEVAQMVKSLPQAGGGTDVQKMLMQQMQQPQAPAAGGAKPPGM